MMRHVLLALPLALLFLILPAFAQEPDNSSQSDIQLNTTASEEPILEQTSEKGIYRVLLKWPHDIQNPQSGIQIEMVFLNASAPAPTPENTPQMETNATGQGTPGASGFTDPSIIETTLPVESYDIAIYDKDGKELWKKTDQPGAGGRGTQRLDLSSNYTGPVTLNVTDIKPGWDAGETATAQDLTDSVTFTATMVPEFPVAAVLLVAGVAGGIAAARLLPARMMR
jgi:hypothetical protein